MNTPEKVQTITMVLWAVLPFVFAGVALFLLPRLLPLTSKLLEWLSLRAKETGNVYVAGVLQRLVDLIGQKVLMVENTVIEDLKVKAKDGKLTKEELLQALAGAKAFVIESVKTDATAQGLWQMAITVFMGNEGALGKWIGDTIEATVAKLPPSGLQTPSPTTGVAAMPSVATVVATVPQ